MPLWELGPKLKELKLDFCFLEHEHQEFVRNTSFFGTDELREEALASFELPSIPWAGSQEEAKELIYRVVFRTVIAVSRGARLTCLLLPPETIQHPFAVRALLPSWVDVVDWAPAKPSELPIKRWYEAAATLRSALSHASFWKHGQIARPSHDQHLTREDMQSLRVYYTTMKHLPGFRFDLIYAEDPCPVVDLYLPWLEEDAELAQRVADTWNAIVRRGEANAVVCDCGPCSLEYRRSRRG